MRVSGIHLKFLIGTVALRLAFAQPAWAAVLIVPPGDDVAGHSQLYWAQAWWQWALGVPTPNDPLIDTTGADAGVNNGGPVFFLAGNLSLTGGVFTRTITVPVGKTIFFPVSNSFYVPIGQDGSENPAPCAAPLTLTCALSQVTVPEDGASNMAVQIDGVSLDNAQISQFRQTSTSYFTVALPQDNVLLEAYDVPVQQCCLNLPSWVQDGYYIALDGLSVGTHVLHFHGETPGFSLDVTDTLNVTVPEPSTWAMMLVGCAGLAFASYRMRPTRRRPLAESWPTGIPTRPSRRGEERHDQSQLS